MLGSNPLSKGNVGDAPTPAAWRHANGPTIWSARRYVNRRRVPVGLAVPAGMVGIALAIPLVYLCLRTLNAGPHLAELLLSARTLGIIVRSLGLTAAVTVVAVLIGVPLAWLTVRTDLPFRRGWLVLVSLPLVLPTYVSGLAYLLALGPKGGLQSVLAPFGVERLPDITGFPGAVLILGLHTYPYVLLPVRAALQRIDPATEEAARSFGRSGWATFWEVVLPQLRPSIAGGGLLAALYALSDFGAVSLVNYETFTWAIYLQYQSAFDRSLAAALSLVLVVIAGIILLIEVSTRQNATYYRSDPGAARRSTLIRLMHRKWFALLFCGGIGLVGVVLPVLVLAGWAIQGVCLGQSPDLLWQAALTSMSVSALAAALTIITALPVAILTVRYPGRLTSLLERATYIGFSLPRVALALGLVFFGASYLPSLYQSMTWLFIAYAILFLPTALGGLATSLRQVTPHLEEAARSLGHRPLQVFFTVTLPIVLPGVMAAAALVFLLTMEELPATLLLRPPGVETLAIAIWSAASEALFTQAAVSSLLLVTVSSLSIGLIFWQERTVSS